MPNHILPRFVVVDNNRLSMVVELLLERQTLVEVLGPGCEFTDGGGNGHLRFRVATVRPVVLVAQIGHPYAFVEEITFILLV